MNISALNIAYEAIEPLAFWVIALLRTDRNHEQKLVLTLFCTDPGRGKSLMEFWTFSKYPLYLSSSLLCSELCIEAPESMTKIRSSVSLAPPQEKKSSCLRLVLAYFSPNSTLLCWYNLLVVRFHQVFLLKTGCARISLMSITFLDCLFFPEFNFVPCAFWEFQESLAEAVNPNSSTFRRIDFIGSGFLRYTTLDFVFPQNSNWSLRSFFSRPRAGFLSPSACRNRWRYPWMHLFPDL